MLTLGIHGRRLLHNAGVHAELGSNARIVVGRVRNWDNIWGCALRWLCLRALGERNIEQSLQLLVLFGKALERGERLANLNLGWRDDFLWQHFIFLELFAG